MALVQEVQRGRAVLRGYQMSASKVREVLDLIRGKTAVSAMETLSLTERGAAPVVAKILRSAVANAGNLHGIPPEELFVATTFADEGVTLKRFRPRARGRAGRILKRSSHVTIIVERLPEEKLRVLRDKQRNDAANRRARRVRGSRKSVADEAQTALDARESRSAIEELSVPVESVDTDVAVTSVTAPEAEAESVVVAEDSSESVVVNAVDVEESSSEDDAMVETQEEEKN